MAAAGFRTGFLALLSAACTSIAVDQGTFAGTRWHVTAINGHRTPASDERFYVEFRQDSFTARMGCNTASGSYSAAGNVLRPGMTVITQAACVTKAPVPIDPMTYERWGFEIVARPMRIIWHSGGRVTLSNGAGAIELEPVR
jgi:heat shock protein HslJ